MGHVGTKQGFEASHAARTLTDSPQYVAVARTSGWPVAAKTGRTLPPPPPLAALQTRSGIAPKAPPLPKTGSVRPSAAPMSNPPGTDELRDKLATAKRTTLRPPPLPRQAEALPIVPQWEANTTPLKPADGQRTQFWMRLAGTGFAAGFFLAAGYLGAMAQQPQPGSLFALGVQHERAPRGLALPLTAAATKIAAPVLTSVAPQQPPMATETPAVTLAAAVAASEAPKAEADASSAKLSVKAAKKSHSTRALHGKSKVAAVAQTDEEEVDDSSDADEEPEAPVARTAPTSNLPEQLTRTDVQKGLESTRSVLATCAAGQHGTTYANVTITGSGHVSYSTVEGAFAGTAAGSCMARALRSSDFPKFSGAPLKVRYPFVF